MRFDDRLTTALREPWPDGPAATAQWRQLLDLLAQRPAAGQQAQAVEALRRLRALHEAVPVGDRARAVAALDGRIRSPALVRFLVADRGPVADAAIMAARLGDGEWAALVPMLTVRARQRLRHLDADGSGLGSATRAVLAALAPVDLALPLPLAELSAIPLDAAAAPEPFVVPPVAAADSPPRATPHQPQRIGALIERIAQFQSAREQAEAPRLPLDDEAEGAAQTADPELGFETDDMGDIRDATGAPRGALVGLNICNPGAYGGPTGTDLAGAEAFRRRMPMRGVRLTIGEGRPISGEWRIAADPFFDPRSGRFQGYRGVMRRPSAGETANPDATGSRMDLRELVHELRTPLGAIIGFAEIIESQLFGPVSQAYRQLAASILEDAQRLLAGFDDLDVAARFEDGRLEDGAGQADVARLIDRLAGSLQSLTDRRGVALRLDQIEPVRPFAQSIAAAERVVGRLLAAVLMAAEPGESISATVRTRVGVAPANCVEVELPRALAGRPAETLFDSAIDDASGEGALLGLGFSFRLVRSLARHSGGALLVRDGRMVLRLPCVSTASAAATD